MINAAIAYFGKTRYRTYVACGLLILLGIAFGSTFIYMLSDESDRSGLYGSFIEAFATFATGIAVALLIQKMLHVQEREKDYILKQLDEMTDLVRVIERDTNGSKVTDVAQNLKQLSVFSSSLVELIDAIKRPGLPVSSMNFTEDIQAIRHSATYTPIASDILDEIDDDETKSRVQDNIIKLGNVPLQNLREQASKLHMKMMKAKISVIKA